MIIGDLKVIKASSYGSLPVRIWKFAVKVMYLVMDLWLWLCKLKLVISLKLSLDFVICNFI